MSLFNWGFGLLLSVSCGVVATMYYSPSTVESLKFKTITTIIQGYQCSNDIIENVKNFVNKSMYEFGLIDPLIIDGCELIIDDKSKYTKIDMFSLYSNMKSKSLYREKVLSILNFYNTRLNIENIDTHCIRVRIMYRLYGSYNYVYTWHIDAPQFNYNSLLTQMDTYDDYNYLKYREQLVFFPTKVFLKDNAKSGNFENVELTGSNIDIENIDLDELLKTVKFSSVQTSCNDTTDITEKYIKYLGPNVDGYLSLLSDECEYGNFNGYDKHHALSLHYFLRDELNIAYDNTNFEIHVIPQTHVLTTILTHSGKTHFTLKLDDNNKINYIIPVNEVIESEHFDIKLIKNTQHQNVVKNMKTIVVSQDIIEKAKTMDFDEDSDQDSNEDSDEDSDQDSNQDFNQDSNQD
jgi:hypothetical protein